MNPGISTFRTALLPLVLPMAAALAGLHLGCTKPQTMVSAAGVPASQGTVKATQGDNGNTKLSIHVKHLAPPSKISPDATVYVVWLQPRNGERQNIGALALDSNLEGSLTTVTPHRRFLVTVTPEAGGQVSQPTHEPVFSSEVDRGD
ncbi:MAG: hypothetical protein IPL96_02490 [Holophagaceae bacterium]|nr:hypothetical protein [Holophagaceae bacterium]